MLQHDVTVQLVTSNLRLQVARDIIENEQPAIVDYLNIPAAIRIVGALASDFILLYTLREIVDSLLRIRISIIRESELGFEDVLFQQLWGLCTYSRNTERVHQPLSIASSP